MSMGIMRQEEQATMETAMLASSPEPVDSSDPDPAGLMERFVSRDPRAARELYRRFAPRIYGIGKAMLGNEAQAQELVEDTFVNLWREAPGFDPARGSLDQGVLLTAFRSVRRGRA
jgi:RNA polymerase sigma-70 factor (ECF subfamily)